jgi:glycosyltransferase involved in cell wall biosynthesis
MRAIAPPNLKLLGFIDVREILMAGDVFLSTSLNEGIPYSILEAQFVGLPVVAVNAGAVSEIVADGVNGYLVQPSAKQIVDKLKELINKPKKVEEMKSNLICTPTSKEVEKNFSIRHLELYQTILNDN